MAQSSASQITRLALVTSDGVTLSVLESGQVHAKKSQLKIALIPGWSMPATIWQKQLEQFGQRYHTLALDPRGQGESQVPIDRLHR